MSILLIGFYLKKFCSKTMQKKINTTITIHYLLFHKHNIYIYTGYALLIITTKLYFVYISRYAKYAKLQLSM